MAEINWLCATKYILADDTVAANIVGVEPKDINQEAVEKAAKIANLHNFVSDELPKNIKQLLAREELDYQRDKDNVLELQEPYTTIHKF